MSDTKSGPGTTTDPNQATKTGQPEKENIEPVIRPDHSDPEDPKTGPGSTNDPNQANRT